MTQDKLNFIHEINTQYDSWMIKVRIVRLWKQPFSLDMILMDEKVEKIQATVKAKLIYTFERLLAEGSVVVLSKFGVAENSGNYRIINHACKLNFYRTTTVKKSEVFEGPVHGFDFVKFDDINNRNVGDEFAIDVIGGVVSCGNMDVYDRNGKESKRISFEMQDSEGKVVSCTLWDNFAQELSTFVNVRGNDGCVILIVQFARIRLWQGTPTIQNALFGTKLFINDNLKDIVDFRKRLISECGDSSSQLFSQLSCQTIFSGRDEFLVHTKRMFVDEISEVRKELKCVVLGTIKSIKKEEGWYYLACRKCNCKAIPKSSIVDLEDIDGSDSNDVNENTLWCRTCRSVANSAVPRLKVVVRVQDGTGTASFVLFHREVLRLTNHSVIDILERQHQDGEVDGTPKELDQMLNKRLIFKIDVSDFNIRTGYSSYTVLKLCDDHDVIESMDVIASESIKNDESSHGCFDSKDVVSCTGDSLAQTDVEDNSPTSPPAKRVREIDDKEMDHQSSTKKQLITVKIEKP